MLETRPLEIPAGGRPSVPSPVLPEAEAISPCFSEAQIPAIPTQTVMGLTKICDSNTRPPAVKGPYHGGR